MNPEPNDGESVRREIRTDQSDPNVEIARTVASLEGKETDEMTPLYKRIDHIVEELFSNPPAPEAEAQVRFTYEGYRIVLDQDGSVEFRKIE